MKLLVWGAAGGAMDCCLGLAAFFFMGEVYGRFFLGDAYTTGAGCSYS